MKIPHSSLDQWNLEVGEPDVVIPTIARPVDCFGDRPEVVLDEAKPLGNYSFPAALKGLGWYKSMGVHLSRKQ
jgi:hypothetical protein